MRTFFILLLAVTTLNCIPSEPIQETEFLGDYERVVEEWNADLSLPAADCSNPHVAILSDSEFREHSGLCPYPNCDGECYFCASAYITYERKNAVLVLSPYLDEESSREGIRHESLHYLSNCTNHDRYWDGMRYPWFNGDVTHSDPRLWGNYGVLDRARLPQE